MSVSLSAIKPDAQGGFVLTSPHGVTLHFKSQQLALAYLRLLKAPHEYAGAK